MPSNERKALNWHIVEAEGHQAAALARVLEACGVAVPPDRHESSEEIRPHCLIPFSSRFADADEWRDFAPFEELGTLLAAPYEDQSALAAYANPPPPGQRLYQTLCGT